MRRRVAQILRRFNMSDVKGSDRVSIEEDVHDIYKSLSDKSSQNPESAPFLLMKDVFMWAVVLGVRSGKRRPLAGSKREIFRWDQFSQDIDIPSLKVLALADKEDVDILLHNDDILRIAEEFANSGIRILKTELLDQPAKSLWNLVNLIRQ
jgi:dnd system-associated protein 4